jgi:arsenate reductase-like glutaredoxin family protein
MPAIQIFFLKKTFDVQKAERFFKERGVICHLVDLNKTQIPARFLEELARKYGPDALLDTTSKAYLESPARYCTDPAEKIYALVQNPTLLRCPITRNLDTREATIGYAPEVWARWVK